MDHAGRNEHPLCTSREDRRRRECWCKRGKEALVEKRGARKRVLFLANRSTINA